jgi:hypothetical protein
MKPTPFLSNGYTALPIPKGKDFKIDITNLNLNPMSDTKKDQGAATQPESGLKTNNSTVVVNEGNGEWYHGYKNPLEHRWHINGNRATCMVCYRIVEKTTPN